MKSAVSFCVDRRLIILGILFEILCFFLFQLNNTTKGKLMKKIAITIMALALASFATLNAQTITKDFRLNSADSSYGPNGKGGAWSVNTAILLGNYYYSGESYLQFNLYEVDISSESFGSITSIDCKANGDFYIPGSGEAAIPSDLPAFSIEIFKGGTGNAKTDYNSSVLTSVTKLTDLTIEDFQDGLVKLDGLDIDVSGEDYFTFMISVDKTLIPELASGGMGTMFYTHQFQITLTGTTAAVPEPSTYAAIFGALALVFAAYRRRK